MYKQKIIMTIEFSTFQRINSAPKTVRLDKIQVTLKTIPIYNTRQESPQLTNYILIKYI